MEIDIVVCIDNKFVMPTGIMIHSICVNNPEVEIAFHVITNQVSDKNKKKLLDTIIPFHSKSIAFYNVDGIDFSDVPRMEDGARLSITTYYRLYLTEILPTTIQKVLYLDGDIIVRQSLKSLWDTDLTNIAIAATTDAHYHLDSYYERLGYPVDKGYFNAGVLLINLEYWREHHLLSAFKDFMKNHADRIVYHDQDVLNYVLQDSKKELPVKFNLQQGFLWRNKPYPQKYIKEIKEAINDCVILHFTGPNPWYKSCRHPYRSTFLKYKMSSAWKNEPIKEDRPLSVRMKKAIATILRKCKLIPELPPYGKGYLPGLKPLD